MALAPRTVQNSFDYTRADKQALAAELGVAHARCVSLKIVSLSANLLIHFGIGGNDRTKRRYQLFDFPLSSRRRWCTFIQAFCSLASLG
jgi:hypothetical protein